MRLKCIWIAVALATLAGAAAAAGCGGGKSSEAPQTVEAQVGLDSRERMIELESRVENGIRDCMSAQGFDYVPVDPTAQQQALTGKARISDADFNRQFGYGITTMFGRAKPQADPNDRIRLSLTGADRAAYDRALWGDNPGAGFAEAADTGDFSDVGGCTKQATDEVFGGADVLTSLVTKLDELDQRIVEDQRMVKATERWSSCMRDKGYDYQESDAIDEDLLKRFRAIVGPGTRSGAIAPGNPGATYDKAALLALQREEVKVVNADLECERQEITPVENKVRPQYENEFRRENSALLTRVRTAQRTGTTGQ
jgi:hypothetical protein